MCILVIGSNGMLGHKTTQSIKHAKVTGLDLPDIDITDITLTNKTLSTHKPDLIINSAAYTDVDGCEANVDHAFTVNSLGPRNLAVVCNEMNIPLVHISTDYIFDGTYSTPYKEWDTPTPKSIYGQSKLLGEQYIRQLCPKHYIIRTSWLYGENGKNFVSTMLGLARERNEISVVNDQLGSPTYTGDLAQSIAQLIQEPVYGTYHLTNSGTCTWYDLTLEIFKQAGISGVKVKSTTTEELNRPAPRPKYSVLDNYIWRLQGNLPLRHYKEALADYLKNIAKEEN